MLKSRWLVLVILVLIGASVALAQEPPAEVNAALDDLSAQIGTTLTLQDLDTFTWNGQTFTDTSLGCPQPDQAYAQVQTDGFQVLLTYQGQLYDYRVTTGGQSIILCPTDAEATAMPTGVPVEATATDVPTMVPTSAVVCTSGLASRLTNGQIARTTPGLSSNVRASADANSDVMGAIQPGAQFTVVSGPSCGPEGLAWWQIQQDQLTGWIAEGQNGIYYIEPIPQPLPALSGLEAVNSANAARLTQLSRIDGNVSSIIAWSPDGLTLAAASSNTVNPGVWLYAATGLDTQPPRGITTDAVPTALAFSGDSALLAVGTASGSVTFYDVASGAAGFSFAAEPSAIRDLRFSADGKVLAVIGEDTSVTLWGVLSPATSEPMTAEVTVESATPGAIPTAQG